MRLRLSVGYLDQVVPAEAEQVGGLAEGVVPPLGDEDGDAVDAAVPERPAQPLLGNAAEIAVRGEEAVARHPEGGDVGDGAAGAEGAEGVLAVVDPGGVEVFRLAVDQVVEHGQHLPLHGGEGLGGLHLDQVLVEGGHQARQREHEIGERRGHVADEAGGGGMDRLGDQVLLDELGVVGDVGRLLRDGGGAEMGLDLFHAPFDGDDVGLEKAGDIGGNRLIDGTEG